MVSINKAFSILVDKLNFIYDWCASLDTKLKELLESSFIKDKDDGISIINPLVKTKYGIIPMLVGTLTGKTLDEATNPLSHCVLNYCDVLHKDGELYLFMNKSKVINKSSYNLGNFYKLSLKDGNYFLDDIPVKILVNIKYEYKVTQEKQNNHSIPLNGEFYSFSETPVIKSPGLKEPPSSKKVTELISLDTDFNELLVDDVELFVKLPKSVRNKSGLTNYIIVYPDTSISVDGVIDSTIPASACDSTLIKTSTYLLCLFKELKSITINYGKVDGSAITNKLEFIDDKSLESFQSFNKTLVRTNYDAFSVNKILSYGFDVDLSIEQILIYCFDYANYSNKIYVNGNNLIAAFTLNDTEYKVDITYHKEFLDIIVTKIMSYLNKDINNELNKKIISLWKRYY